MCDEHYMARAMQLAECGKFTTTPNPNVGCVIVRNGQIVGEGWHQRAGGPHAEIHALRMAGSQASGATAYVTLEPCCHVGRTPPCCDALIKAGIKRVVAAMEDPNPEVAGRGLYRLKQAGIDVVHGVMHKKAEAINRGFLKRMRTGLPWVQLKLAASLDGRTAMASGESQWITSSQARCDVQFLRAQSSAILSSSETVLADNPALTVRWRELDSHTRSVYSQADIRQPVRVIVDSRNRVTPQHRLISQPGNTLLARLRADTQCWPQHTQQIILPSLHHQVDLVSLMMMMGKRQLNSIWVEAGASLAGALITAGLVDEMIIYMAAKLLGDDARALCQLPSLKQLSKAPRFTFTDVRQLGPDLRLILAPV